MNWKETAIEYPDADLLVLTCANDGEIWPGYWDGEVWVGLSDVNLFSISHWMSLPDPPVKVRVRLLVSLNPEELPVGTKGTVIDGTMKKPGMVRVLWDNGMNIPMYRNELEVESI